VDKEYKDIMVKKAQAIRPASYKSISEFIKPKEREEDEAELTDDEKVLGQGANTKFWKVLSKHINNNIKDLDAIAEAAIAQGMPLEEIGRNTIVISQVKGVLENIFNIVEDSRESLDNGQTK